MNGGIRGKTIAALLLLALAVNLAWMVLLPSPEAVVSLLSLLIATLRG